MHVKNSLVAMLKTAASIIPLGFEKKSGVSAEMMAAAADIPSSIETKAAQQGIDFILKRGDGASPEVFTTVGGFRSNTFTINKDSVDVTTKSHTDRWRRRLANVAIRDLNVSGSGIFEASTQEAFFRSDMFGSTLHNYQIVVPGLGTFEGAFDLTSLEYGGDFDGVVTFNVSLVSAGAPTFT